MQGKSYLGTFQVDGTNDLDPSDLNFTFFITPLGIPVGTWVTITANYSTPTDGTSQGAPWALTSPFCAPTLLALPIDILPVRLEIQPVGTQLQITWSGQSIGYRLQSAFNLKDPQWEDVPNGTVQPVLLDMVSGPQFFRMTQ